MPRPHWHFVPSHLQFELLKLEFYPLCFENKLCEPLGEVNTSWDSEVRGNELSWFVWRFLNAREFCQISKYEEIPFLVKRNFQVNHWEVWRNGLLVRMGVSIALKYFATIPQINLAFRAYKPITEIENSFLHRVKQHGWKGNETRTLLTHSIYLEDKHDLFQILSQENRNTILQYWHDERER